MLLKELLDTGQVEEAKGVLDQPVGGLVYDSRSVKRGDVFFALPGESTDGHHFISEAVKRGAAAVVLERRVPLPQDVTWVRVGNARRKPGFSGWQQAKAEIEDLSETSRWIRRPAPGS